ncbi:unnamed protein product [Aureobasidium mustum]|uniref:Uncharacterized protein n=1 Tax=Aureobasidium mustum TaxID=2773714 RepID=A0A9N8JZV7_9PEZI|nr:unnamed protein product [Aureobasidium mustum]
MLSTPFTSSILLLASSVLVNAAGFASREPSLPSCQGFSITINETRPLEFEDLVISTGVVCNVSGSNYSTPCSVVSGGWPTLQNSITYTNGSRVNDSYAVGYALWNATGDSKALYGNSIAAVENQTVTFENNTSGHVNACYPEFTDRVVSFESAPGHFENITVLAGSRSINETIAQAAANLKQNPNNHPPYGLVSSGADAAMKLAGVGLTSVWVIATFWLGL